MIYVSVAATLILMDYCLPPVGSGEIFGILLIPGANLYIPGRAEMMVENRIPAGIYSHTNYQDCFISPKDLAR